MSNFFCVILFIQHRPHNKGIQNIDTDHNCFVTPELVYISGVKECGNVHDNDVHQLIFCYISLDISLMVIKFVLVIIDF